MAEKKLSYREVPTALGYVIKILWNISPSYVVLSVCSTLVNRTVPYATLFITASITNRLPGLILHHAQVRPILVLVALLLVLQLANQIFTLVTQYSQQKAESKVAIEMRERFYQAYARLPYASYEDKSVIDAFQYADNFMYRFSQFGLLQIMRALGGVLEIVGATIALVAVAWYLPILFLVFLPFLVRSILRLNRMQAQVYLENRSPERRVWAIEALFYPRKIKETRLYGVVNYLLTERRRHAEKIKKRELVVEYRRSRVNFVQDSELQLAGFVATAIAVWRIAYQGSPIGTFLLAQQLTSRAGAAVQSLFTELGSFDQDLYGFAEYRYITETLQPTPTSLDQPAILQPDIELQHLHFCYPEADVAVLHDASLTIPFGSTLAIVGENGAGKTTLIKLLLGLYKPTSGSILINGRSLSEINESKWLGCIGVLLQDFGMNEDITIREAVWLGDITKPAVDASIYAVLEAAELARTVRELPHGLDTYLGKWIDDEKGVELSGGQLQRLAIARALFRQPDILILDEPTSAIDALAEERIFNRLLKTRAGRTTVFISHRFSTVRRAEKIVYMEKGTISEVGTHAELITHAGGYAHMYDTQAEGYK